MPERLFMSIRNSLAALDRNFDSEVQNDLLDIPFHNSPKNRSNGLKTISKDANFSFEKQEITHLDKYSIEEIMELDNQLKYLVDIEFNKWISEG